MSEYIKLAEAPTISYSYPTCGACVVDLESDSDGWTCPVCGTSWSHRDGDGDTGTLYESWAGEELDGETLSEDEARKAGIAYEDAEAKANYKRWGWCDHGMVGKCWRTGCAGGKNATALAGKESDR